MKRISVFFLALTFLYACSKSNNAGSSRPDVTGFPTASSLYDAANHILNLRTYLYDSSQNLAGVFFRENDTTNVGAGIFTVDSGSYRFHVDPATNLPSGYLLDYRKGSVGGQTVVESHLLYYNPQHQLIKDSGLLAVSGQNPNPPTKYYLPAGNTIVCNTFRNGSASQKDTLISANGNLVYAASYLSNGSGWTKAFSISYTYSTAAGPFYNQGLSNSLGAFLMEEGIGDFLSKNLTNNNGFAWVVGGNGKVASGSTPNGDYASFTY